MKIGCPLFDRGSYQCNGPWEGSFNDGTTQAARGLPFGQPARTNIEAGPPSLGWESGGLVLVTWTPEDIRTLTVAVDPESTAYQRLAAVAGASTS